MKAPIIERKILSSFSSFILLFFFFTKLNGQILTPEQFVEDLEFVKSELPKRHKNLFAKISEKEFNNRIEYIERKSKDLNNESFEIESSINLLKKLVMNILGLNQHTEQLIP